MSPPSLRSARKAAPTPTPPAPTRASQPRASKKRRVGDVGDDDVTRAPVPLVVDLAVPGVVGRFSRAVRGVEQSTTGDTEELEGAISHGVIDLVGAHGVRVFALEDGGRRIRRLRDAPHAAAPIPEGGYVAQAVRARHTLRYGADSHGVDAETDLGGVADDAAAKHFVAIPAVEEETGHPLLCVVAARTHDFSPADAALCDLLAAHLALAYKHVQRTISINSIAADILQELNADKLLRKILAQASALLECDRCSIFLVDEEQNELYSKVFDVSSDGARTEEVRFPKALGIAGHVVATGQALVISDAYQDPRFNRDVDQQTGYRTRNILAIPLLANKRVIGVAQFINKLSHHSFTVHDLKSAEIFAHFAGLAISNAKLCDSSFKSEQRLKVALDVIAYHTKPAAERVDRLVAAQIPLSSEVPGFHSFTWDKQSCPLEQTPILVLKMFHDLAFVKRFQIPHRPLCHFILSIIEGYRDVPYHNWRHAFSVSHSMYAIAMSVPLDRYLLPHEVFGLFVACLCHDIDHRGRNNAFQVIKGDPLAKVYPGSYLEFHHFNYAMAVLSAESNNILQNVSQDLYKLIVEQIRTVILATDLANHFKAREKFRTEILEPPGRYSKESQHHRELLCETITTCCDISSAAMPFDVNAAITKTVYEEFFQQGDEEKALGKQPNPTMDREKAAIPQLQLSFVDHIAGVAFGNLAAFFPELKPLHDQVYQNRKDWEGLQNLPRDDPHAPIFLPTH